MADDIDDLLDEVENKFLANSSKFNCKKQSDSVPKNRTKSKQSTNDSEDLNSIIDDICDVQEPLERRDVGKDYQNVNRVVTPTQSKCYPLYLGGTSCVLGRANSTSKRCCDKMRCTDCDFKIAIFDDFSWHPSTDYLFLRNNVPDFKKLSPKLVSKKGSRAYCCQCQWRTVLALTDASTDRDLKWVCGKH